MNISIIGAGPVGNYTAFLLARQGHDVHIFEEHADIGKPIQCTGLMTMSLRDVFVPVDDYVTNVTKQIEVIAPNGKNVVLNAQEYIVDRTAFDSHLAQQAQQAGAVLHLDHRFLGKNGKVLTFKKSKEIVTYATDILVGADGANSTVAKLLNPERKRNYCVGIQARVRGTFNSSAYKVYFDNNISPGFFAWVVPESETVARVGLKGTSGNFQSFLDKFGYKRIEMQSGPIPVYDLAYVTESDDIYLVGDAATQVKATTAGGIIPGLKAAQCLADALKYGDSYTKRWKKKIGRDLWLHLKIRNILDTFSNDDWNKLIHLIGQSHVRAVFEKHDRENPWKLMKVVLKEPRLLLFGRKLIA